MKKIILILAAAAALTMVCACATAAKTPSRHTTTKTFFEGQNITGIEASSAFKVILVKSNTTKAVVEIDSELAHYLDIEMEDGSIVEVGLDDVPQRFWRGRGNQNLTMKITLYLPTLNVVHLSGAVSLATQDTFTASEADIHLTGASSMKGITLSIDRLKVQASGASSLSLVLPATRDLIAIASGAANVNLTASGVENSKIGVSGASRLDLSGDGTRGDWTVSGASSLRAGEFDLRQLKVEASGASNARVNVSADMIANASGGSSIRYGGNPGRVKKDESGAASVRSF